MFFQSHPKRSLITFTLLTLLAALLMLNLVPPAAARPDLQVSCPSQPPLFNGATLDAATATPVPCATDTPVSDTTASTATPSQTPSSTYTTDESKSYSRLVFNQGHDVYLTDGLGSANLIIPNAQQAVWSPDGKTLAYVSTAVIPIAPYLVSNGIWLVSVDDYGVLGSARQIVSGSSPFSPMWSPDGHYIAYLADDGIVEQTRSYSPSGLDGASAGGRQYNALWVVDTTNPNDTGKMVLDGANFCNRTVGGLWSYNQTNLWTPSWIPAGVPDFDGSGAPYHIAFTTFATDPAFFINTSFYAESGIWVYNFNPTASTGATSSAARACLRISEWVQGA